MQAKLDKSDFSDLFVRVFIVILRATVVVKDGKAMR